MNFLVRMGFVVFIVLDVEYSDAAVLAHCHELSVAAYGNAGAGGGDCFDGGAVQEGLAFVAYDNEARGACKVVAFATALRCDECVVVEDGDVDVLVSQQAASVEVFVNLVGDAGNLFVGTDVVGINFVFLAGSVAVGVVLDERVHAGVVAGALECHAGVAAADDGAVESVGAFGSFTLAGEELCHVDGVGGIDYPVACALVAPVGEYGHAVAVVAAEHGALVAAVESWIAGQEGTGDGSVGSVDFHTQVGACGHYGVAEVVAFGVGDCDNAAALGNAVVVVVIFGEFSDGGRL